MLFRQEENTSVGLKLTSLIDVIFILLLFFIVTSVIMKQAGGRLGERAYLKVQNVFSENSSVNAYVTVFLYFDAQGRVKYRLIHKGNEVSPVNYFASVARESAKKEPSSNALIRTTPQLLTNPDSPLARDMDRLDGISIRQVLRNYKKILADNDLNFAIVAQPDIPFFDVIQLYSFMKTSTREDGLGASSVVLLEFDGSLNDLVAKIKGI